MNPKPGIASTLVLFAFLATSGHGLPCNGDITTIGTGAATFYLDDRSGAVGDFNHWTYLESNDVEGLQSGGDHLCIDDCLFDDPCRHTDPDTLIL